MEKPRVSRSGKTWGESSSWHALMGSAMVSAAMNGHVASAAHQYQLGISKLVPMNNSA